VRKVRHYGGTGSCQQGDATFDYPAVLPDDSFACRGAGTLDNQGATAGCDTSSIELNCDAKDVYLVAGGDGTVAVNREGYTTNLPISGPPLLRQIAAGDAIERGHLEVRLSKGLQAFSFTYG
jgi:hypothetical protein